MKNMSLIALSNNNYGTRLCREIDIATDRVAIVMCPGLACNVSSYQGGTFNLS